ncbi:type VI secretion system protein TssL, long form [Marichromatium gracile]|uniref:type VI secretion system protein TssL, long form n=1 Tax=Marichromatium gracile TaxID=1048 RepID=UPI001F308EAC|nr:type VI secretion system protein TssL, long form [Marichromatium gracile]MCF1183189.1 type VI secretion system protein TssL, long form [Marichromatium gracile]
MAEECECEEVECEAGAPAWMSTFADLMSLLMVFFVLLLSFSEMDVLKYKQIAGSMKMAFGVQRMVDADDIPKGTSIIAQEFSPAQPQPTVVNEVRQQTADDLKSELRIVDPAIIDAQKKAEEVEKALELEIKKGLLEVTTIDDQVVVRIREKGSFPSASAQVSAEFLAVLQKIAKALSKVEGKILVAGHTDDIPIQTREFASNWVLSAARAAAVAHAVTQNGWIDPQRVEIRAHADNLPLESNDTAEGRATNRRVEIIVLGDRSTELLLENALQAIGSEETIPQ